MCVPKIVFYFWGESNQMGMGEHIWIWQKQLDHSMLIHVGVFFWLTPQLAMRRHWILEKGMMCHFLNVTSYVGRDQNPCWLMISSVVILNQPRIMIQLFSPIPILIQYMIIIPFDPILHLTNRWIKRVAMVKRTLLDVSFWRGQSMARLVICLWINIHMYIYI